MIIIRLWHQFLISKLPRQQLLGQHRECAALRGAGWGRRHSVVNYVFEHDPALLVAYHCLVLQEMVNRGYNPDPIWKDPLYRGKVLKRQEDWCDPAFVEELYYVTKSEGITIYPEHDEAYLQECIENLKQKGIKI